ncbi:MAG: glycosyltransferase, partial [Clostridia bacterium]
ILIVTPHIIVGGVEKALINMVKAIPKDEYDVFVRFVKKQGGFECDLPDDVAYSEINVTEIQKELLLCGGAKRAVINLIKKGKIIKATKVMVGKLRNKPFPEFVGKFQDIPSDEKEYDYAICYHMHMPFIVAYVAEKIKAKNKICWMHNDFSTTNFSVTNIEMYLRKYDKFYVVSQQLLSEFRERMPEMTAKSEIFYNLINKQDILKKSEEELAIIFDKSIVNIVSVGRLVCQKGFDMAIDVARDLVDANVDFVWYVVGDGQERSNLKKQIKINKLEKQFILLGSQNNPYPYMRNCDIYVQPSRSEGYGITISEIKLFNKPIVCTDFAGAHEQLDNRKDSKIVKFDRKEIFNALREFCIKCK